MSRPTDTLGAVTVAAALKVDLVAIQLLGACAFGDPSVARLAEVRAALAAWPEVEAAMRELARVAGEPIGLAAANDQHVNASTRLQVCA